MTSTRHAPMRSPAGRGRPRSTRSARIGSWTWKDPVVRAWVTIGLIPVFALLAAGAAWGVFTLLGHGPGVDEVPVPADRAAGLAGLVVLMVPCVLAVRQADRARTGGDPRGWPPLVLALLLGGCWIAAGALVLAGSL